VVLDSSLSLSSASDQQLLDGVLELLNLRLELTAFVGGDGAGDDRAGDAACTPERLLGRHEHVRDVLVLRQQRQVQQNLQRLRVGRHDHELRNAAVQRLGGLVGALLQLLVIRCLLHDVRDRVGQLRVCEGVRLGVYSLGAHGDRKADFTH